MISYAAVDLTEDSNLIKCNVEMHTLEANKEMELGTKTTKTMYVELDTVLISEEVDQIMQGDIIVVKHDDEKILEILQKDEEEKQRRIAYLEELLEDDE